jgi:dCMP deaminase
MENTETKSQFFTETKAVSFADMNLKEQNIIVMLDTIRRLSPADKKKVGAIIGDPETGAIFTIGYNKMFETLQNQNCEDTHGVTIPYVIHAEEQASINYMKQSFNQDTSKLTMYVSYAPCLFCSKMTAHVGIHRLIFIEKHPLKFDNVEHSPRAFLDKMGFEVIQIVNIP